MKRSILRAAALTAALSAAPCLVLAAATAKPIPVPTPTYPSKAMHVTLMVEVNKHGQVVRVAHGKLSGDQAFDTMTLGNAMQMWIRRKDGTAETGLYSVTYDYDPRTHRVNRVPELVKAGGNWADKPGAATSIINDAKREVQKAEARLRAEKAKERQESAKHLPDINAAVKRAVETPAPRHTPERP